MIIPKSVQPGIPKLPKKKVDLWETVTMKEIFDVVEKPAKIAGKELYTLVTVKRSRGGVEKRGELYGNQIKTKTQFYVYKGNFLISRRQIVHGACGVVPEDLDGAVVSNEYLVLKAKDNYDLEFGMHP